MFFKEIIGQTAAKKLLLQTAREGRVAHAQLLLGAEGNGTLGLALAYAQYILCENPGHDDACGQCKACLKTQKNIHPDVHFSYPTVGAKGLSTEVLAKWRAALSRNPYMNVAQWLAFLDSDNKQGNITAAECLDISKKLSMKAFEGKYKVLILWLPEYLGKEGNRLLKLIEEPPENTVFLLVAQQQELILNTILSRCQLVKISPLEDDDIINILETKYYLKPEQARTIAYLADGNYNEAMNLLETTEINQAAEFLKWFRTAYKGDPSEQVAWTENMAKTGRETQKHFFKYVLFFLREYCVVLMTEQPSLRFRDEENAAAKNMTKVISFEKIGLIQELVNQTLFAIERNANPKILFLDCSVKLHHILRN